MRWDGWKSYNSENLYERLCLSFDSNPSNEQIEENCRQLLVWWQKKLPLKNQPSNPMAQVLRSGLDEAPKYLIQARTELLNPESRARLDEHLRLGLKFTALEEFRKYLDFVLSSGVLSEEDEANLTRVGQASGLEVEEIAAAIEAELLERGAKRKRDLEPESSDSASEASVSIRSSDPEEEFRRLLRLSGLGDEEEMTDDQRDALCNMGENLGLTGGQAEDLIDEYLEEVSLNGIATATPPKKPTAARPATPPPKVNRPAVSPATPLNRAGALPTPQRNGGVGTGNPPVAPKPAPPGAAAAPKPHERPKNEEVVINVTPLARAQEKEKHPAFKNSLKMEMLLVTSGAFLMGSDAPNAAPNEKPTTRISISCFYLSRFPITNAQYEMFDRAHSDKRAPWADDNHPVVYVSHREAVRFCEWLSKHEGKKYRLPTEAEWEYAARGLDNRPFPWGGELNRGNFANFADVNTNFAWRDPSINDGFAQSSPVGNYPLGASPFGIEDMAGNVWEWCQDYFELYKGKPVVNPKGPASGMLKVYRGGSWKSRSQSLRTSCRGYNQSDFSSNDVGFRVVCECK